MEGGTLSGKGQGATSPYLNKGDTKRGVGLQTGGPDSIKWCRYGEERLVVVELFVEVYH